MNASLFFIDVSTRGHQSCSFFSAFPISTNGSHLCLVFAPSIFVSHQIVNTAFENVQFYLSAYFFIVEEREKILCHMIENGNKGKKPTFLLMFLPISSRYLYALQMTMYSRRKLSKDFIKYRIFFIWFAYISFCLV